MDVDSPSQMMVPTVGRRVLVGLVIIFEEHCKVVKNPLDPTVLGASDDLIGLELSGLGRTSQRPMPSHSETTVAVIIIILRIPEALVPHHILWYDVLHLVHAMIFPVHAARVPRNSSREASCLRTGASIRHL